VFDISRLSFVDTKCRDAVLGYVKSSRFIDRIRSVMLTETDATDKRDVRNVSKVIKRATMILPTGERILIMHTFMNKAVRNLRIFLKFYYVSSLLLLPIVPTYLLISNLSLPLSSLPGVYFRFFRSK